MALVLLSLAVAFGRLATAESIAARRLRPPTQVVFVCEHGSVKSLDVCGFVPRLLSASDVDDVALVVSFDEDISQTVGGRARYLKWDDLPGVLANYPRGRDAIVSQVDALIEALALNGSP